MQQQSLNSNGQGPLEIPWSPPHASPVPQGLPSYPFVQRLESMLGSFTEPDRELKEEFRKLAAQWHRETDHFSNIIRKAMSSAYQEIIGMGEKAIPFILRDLETTGGHWFWALRAIARYDAAAGIDNYDDAVRAWLKWGSRQHGYQPSV